MLNTQKLLYVLPDLAYIAELLPDKKPHTFSIQSFKQINGEFLNDKEFIAENIVKLVNKLEEGEEYFLVLPDFLFTNTIISVEETSDTKIKDKLNSATLPELGLKDDSHLVETVVLNQLKGTTRIQISAIEKKILSIFKVAIDDKDIKITGIAPISWVVKSMISLEPSISVLQLGSHLYTAQHYIGVDQTTSVGVDQSENIIETIKTLKGAEPSIQTVYLCSNDVVEEKLKSDVSKIVPVQQMAGKSSTDKIPSYVSEIINASVRTLDIPDFSVPTFKLSKATKDEKDEYAGILSQGADPAEDEAEDDTESTAEIPKPTVSPAADKSDTSEDQEESEEKPKDIEEIKETPTNEPELPDIESATSETEEADEKEGDKDDDKSEKEDDGLITAGSIAAGAAAAGSGAVASTASSTAAAATEVGAATTGVAVGKATDTETDSEDKVKPTEAEDEKTDEDTTTDNTSNSTIEPTEDTTISPDTTTEASEAETESKETTEDDQDTSEPEEEKPTAITPDTKVTEESAEVKEEESEDSTTESPDSPAVVVGAAQIDTPATETATDAATGPSTDQDETEDSMLKQFTQNGETAVASDTTTKPVIKNKSGSKNMMKMILITTGVFILTVAIGIGVGLAILKYSGADNNLIGTPTVEVEQDESTSEPTPEPTPTPTPTPEVIVDKATVEILVVNATTRAGYAGDISDLLEEAEFENVTAGNARGDYEEGYFIYMSEENQALMDAIEEATDLSLTATDSAQTEDAQGQYDAVVVLAQ